MSLMKPIRNWSIFWKSMYNIYIISFLSTCSELIWNPLDFKFTLKPFKIYILKFFDSYETIQIFSFFFLEF